MGGVGCGEGGGGGGAGEGRGGDSALAKKHVTVSPLSVWLEKTKHVSPYF